MKNKIKFLMKNNPGDILQNHNGFLSNDDFESSMADQSYKWANQKCDVMDMVNYYPPPKGEWDIVSGSVC